MFDQDGPPGNFLTPVNVASSLFFESAPELFRRVHRELRPRTPVPEINVEYKRFANANSDVRLESGTIRVRITDLLESAPAPVTEALAYILLGKLYRKPVPRQYAHRYRLYLNRKDVRRQISLIRQTRGRKGPADPAGSVHNLEQLFEEINAAYFGGMMARPALGWSRLRSRTRLGHFDPSHNMIVISRIFDDARAPRLALEYVMYHEMLHLQYPVDHAGARRCVHTPEFKAHEKLFPKFKEAKALLRKLP
ncbi:MAG TPA: SprT-like domain-containing protein [Bryobacteraceae bacterium]|jgi:predicted metal-dependent hydrolase|nr:SprT-like domain-containing protein [Bryobacteraceae bacterium]